MTHTIYETEIDDELEFRNVASHYDHQEFYEKVRDMTDDYSVTGIEFSEGINGTPHSMKLDRFSEDSNILFAFFQPKRVRLINLDPNQLLEPEKEFVKEFLANYDSPIHDLDRYSV